MEALYGQPVEAATVKEVDRITPHYRAYIEASPFASLATSGPEGLDCSPRGDKPGFVRVADEKTMMLPDRRGNNRIDSLRNIVRDPRVSLLFLIPGIGETFRENGDRLPADAQEALEEDLADLRQNVAKISEHPTYVGSYRHGRMPTEPRRNKRGRRRSGRVVVAREDDSGLVFGGCLLQGTTLARIRGH